MTVEYKEKRERFEFYYEFKHKDFFEEFYISDKLARDKEMTFKLIDLKICEMLDRAYRLGLEEGGGVD